MRVAVGRMPDPRYSSDGPLTVRRTATARSPLVEREVRPKVVWSEPALVIQPSDPRNALRALKAAAKRAKLPSTVGMHNVRHSAASVMLSAGVCRSKWSLRSSVTRASRSLGTSMATSRLTCLVTH